MLRTFDDIYETMPWDAVDAVVFDVGQVLLSYNPQEILDEHVPDRPDLHPILLEKIFRSPYWLMRDHGLMTRDEAIEAMIGRDEPLRPYITRVMHNWVVRNAADCGCGERPYITRVMHNWVDLKKVLPEGLKTLQSCKAHGKKVYVLSNYADDAFAVVEHKYDFFNLFDAKFVSGRLKLMKPSEQIFQYVISATGHEPSRVLFLDDTPGNVEGALFCGWQSLCVSHPGKLTEFFGLE